MFKDKARRRGEEGLFKERDRDFPDGPVVKIPGFQCKGRDSIPGRPTKIPHASGTAKTFFKKIRKGINKSKGLDRHGCFWKRQDVGTAGA